MAYTRLRISVEDGVGWFEFDHRPINAFDWAMLGETPDALAELLGRKDVCVAVVASGPEAWFAAGAEVEVLRARGGQAMREWTRLSQRVPGRGTRSRRCVGRCSPGVAELKPAIRAA